MPILFHLFIVKIIRILKKEAETQGATDIIIAKHRNGALADIRLVFLKQFSKFANPARSDQQINPLEGVKDLRI